MNDENLSRLHEILREATTPYPIIGRENINLHLIEIGVDKVIAETHKTELIEILKTYPQPDRLAQGPSYIEVGAILDSQHAALALFALGHVIGLWKVITPATLGLSGEIARGMAGSGFVMISGFNA